jgi:hypothetical protein
MIGRTARLGFLFQFVWRGGERELPYDGPNCNLLEAAGGEIESGSIKIVYRTYQNIIFEL